MPQMEEVQTHQSTEWMQELSPSCSPLTLLPGIPPSPMCTRERWDNCKLLRVVWAPPPLSVLNSRACKPRTRIPFILKRRSKSEKRNERAKEKSEGAKKKRTETNEVKEERKDKIRKKKSYYLIEGKIHLCRVDSKSQAKGSGPECPGEVFEWWRVPEGSRCNPWQIWGPSWLEEDWFEETKEIVLKWLTNYYDDY